MLQKGERLDLTRAHAALNKLSFHAEWEVAPDGKPDLDISAFLLAADNQVRDPSDFVYHNRSRTHHHGVLHAGGGRTTRGMGTHLRANLGSIPAEIQRVAITLTPHQDSSGRLRGWPATVRFTLRNDQQGTVLAESLSHVEPASKIGLLLGNLYRHAEHWKFQALNQVFPQGLMSLCNHYGLTTEPRQQAGTLAPPTAPPTPQPSGPRLLQKGEKAGLNLPATGMLLEICWRNTSDGDRYHLEAGAFLLRTDEHVNCSSDFVYTENRCDQRQAVTLLDRATKDGERFRLVPERFDETLSKIVFVIALKKGFERRQAFGHTGGVSLRLFNEAKELLCFPTGGDDDDTAIIVAELYSYKGKWKFQATGRGISGGMDALCRHYGLQALKVAPTPQTAYRRIDQKPAPLQFVAKKSIQNSKEAMQQQLAYFFADSGRGLLEFRSPIRLDIYIIEPSSSRNYYTLMTHGTSQNNEAGLELVCCLPTHWKMGAEDLELRRFSWPLSLLREVAALHVLQKQSLLPSSIIDNGKPYAENTRFCGVLIYIPALFLDFEDAQTSGGKGVQLLSLIPLFKEEMTFAAANGAESLIERFSDANIVEIIDIDRKNVAEIKQRSPWFDFKRR